MIAFHVQCENTEHRIGVDDDLNVHLFDHDEEEVEALAAMGLEHPFCLFVKRWFERDNCAVIEIASLTGRFDIVKELLDRHPHLHNPTGLSESLRSAATNGHTSIAEYLLGLGADVHHRVELPLRCACQDGHSETVKLLLKAGANPNVYRAEALLDAIEYGHIETVKVLLENGTDPSRLRYYNHSRLFSGKNGDEIYELMSKMNKLPPDDIRDR